MKKIILLAVIFIGSISSAKIETDNCVRGSLKSTKSWTQKLYDGKMLFLANIAIINPDGSYIMKEAFLDWTGVPGPVVGYEAAGKATFKYVTQDGYTKERTLSLYKYTPTCQKFIIKRAKTDKEWMMAGSEY